MEINIQNVNMTYPNGKIALKDLNLDLKAPSLIGLLGPNGAGKSTLMKLLGAALMPTGGSILMDGQPLSKTDRLLKARLGYLPQDFGLFDELTVTQFLDRYPKDNPSCQFGRKGKIQNPHPLWRPASAGRYCTSSAGESTLPDF